jgi:hypothetical protein
MHEKEGKFKLRNVSGSSITLKLMKGKNVKRELKRKRKLKRFK